MNLEGDFGAGSASSSRAFAAAGADSMRCRVDELVTVLRAALDMTASMPSPSVDALDETLGLALEAAQDIRDGLGKIALSRDMGAEAARSIDVHDPLETALRMTRSIVGRRARLVRQYDRVPAVHAGKIALTRVFAQLLQNAADGLTIARSEVLAAGGTMRVESVEGRGTRVTVRLPGIAGLMSTTQRLCASELPHRRVMVVADDRPTGARLRALFGDERTLVVVADSDEAVERLAMGEPCDLVVVDAEDDACEGLRERLAEAAPDVVMRTFELNTSAVESVMAVAVATTTTSGLWSVATR